MQAVVQALPRLARAGLTYLHLENGGDLHVEFGERPPELSGNTHIKNIAAILEKNGLTSSARYGHDQETGSDSPAYENDEDLELAHIDQPD